VTACIQKDSLPETEPFSHRLLRWWKVHGRHDLPWQHERTPYRVWVAEIMLQQTQAGTVIPYFLRFIKQFPDLKTLARADQDAVMSAWSGLGYYARARNLHKTARICAARHNGQLPQSPDELVALPGIGRSTANAIAAQAFDTPVAILDGNVKRVLARHAGITGWPGRSAVERKLRAEAKRRMPATNAASYTQAIMDLGAGICTRHRPQYRSCPVASDCFALHNNQTRVLPAPRPKRKRPLRALTLFLASNKNGEVLMQKRPSTGIWGGLWSLPEAGDLDPELADGSSTPGMTMHHELTHLRLEITVKKISFAPGRLVAESPSQRWMKPARALELGLPQPIRALLEDQ